MRTLRQSASSPFYRQVNKFRLTESYPELASAQASEAQPKAIPRPPGTSLSPAAEKLRDVVWRSQSHSAAPWEHSASRLTLACQPICMHVWALSAWEAPRTLTAATSLPRGSFRAWLWPGLKPQSCGKSQFLFIRGDVKEDGEPRSMCAGIRIDWGLVINLFRP